MNNPLFMALSELLGERFTTGDYERQQHGKDESSLRPMAPDAVCFPLSTEEVAAIVRLCGQHHTPLIPFGAGSSLEGHIFAPRGGVSVDLSRMDQILRVSPNDMDCTVQAGVTRQQLDKYLRPQGLFFPVDPGADATFGGMTSTRASGTNAVRYGTMRENVLALTVVMTDGQIMHTGTRARKSSAGYDLTRLFVGAEGTLGIITEITLRIQGVPEAISAAVVGFGDFNAAVQAVTQVMQSGVPVARIEFLDEVMVKVVNKFSGLTLTEQPTLFLEFHGTKSGVREHAEQVGEIMREWGGSDFKWTSNNTERTTLWTARHNAYYASLAFRPGCRVLSTDVCVPISRLAECIVETKQDLGTSFLSAPIVGHVGDGNFHLLLLIDPNNPQDYAEAARLNERLVRRALAMDGTITGEHGVGIGKQKYMLAEHGAPALAAMRAIKQALDPENLMNPAKLVPAEAAGNLPLSIPPMDLPAFIAGPEPYTLGLDSQPQAGVPQGEVTKYHWVSERIYPGTGRDYWLYVPQQYNPAEPACLMVFQDGGLYLAPDCAVPQVFDNLIHKGDMPVTIGLFINPGDTGPGLPLYGGNDNRSLEYDALGSQYARFLLEELLPEVEKHYNITPEREGRAICGMSSGAICALNTAWERPDVFSKVVSHCGSYTDIRGGHNLSSMIRRAEPKPLRIFIQSGAHDLNVVFGNWPAANHDLAATLAYRAYDYQFVFGEGYHTLKHGGAIFPDTMRWLWRDYPKQ